VSVIDPGSNTVTATVNVVNEPLGVAVSPTGPDAGDVYVTNQGIGTVSVINPATNTVAATIPVGSLPDGVAVSAPPARRPATCTSPTKAATR
jgi:YVTN family beta-propeller protein